MVLNAPFNSISVISRQQLILFMLSWVSPVLGWALKCLAQGHSHEKTPRIQCSSNPGPLDYESNTLPLSHSGPSSLFSCNLLTSVMHSLLKSKTTAPNFLERIHLSIVNRPIFEGYLFSNLKSTSNFNPEKFCNCSIVRVHA